MNRRALLLVNPHARRGQEGQLQAVQQLQSLGLELIEESAENPKILSDLIRQYHNKVDCVIIGSGDGTINAALDGLIDTKLPLGILPLGTANNLARNLEIPPSLSNACQIIAEGNQRRIDLGCINGKAFLNVAGMGLSAEINKTVKKEFKRRWGIFAYIATAAPVLWKSRPFWAEIRSNERQFRVKTVQITVCNGRYYGTGLSVAPDATIDDRRLDLYCIEVHHWWQIFALLPAILQGKPANGIQTLQSQHIEIFTRRPHVVDVDGEIATMTPVEFRILPEILSVYVPKSS